MNHFPKTQIARSGEGFTNSLGVDERDSLSHETQAYKPKPIASKMYTFKRLTLALITRKIAQIRRIKAIK